MGRHNELVVRKIPHMLQYEQPVWAAGELVAGLDEAGVGPLAGPIVAFCVVLNPLKHAELVGVTDSKKMSPAARNHFVPIIAGASLATGVGYAESKEVDAFNCFQASLLAMRRAYSRAVEQLADIDRQKLSTILIDGPHRSLEHVKDLRQEAIVRGDSKSLTIAAASVLAKELRDQLMCDYDKIYPKYGFAQHKGYGTELHLKALAEHGPCSIHRLSFSPVKMHLGDR